MAYLTESGLTNLVIKVKALVSAHKNETNNPHRVTKAQIGLEKAENKSSADIRSELTKDNVITALGYTPGSSEDTNTTYSLSKSGSTITLTGSDGSTTSVTDDAVSVTQKLTSGTEIGTVTVNGTGTKLYAPTNTDTHYTSKNVVGSSTATSNTTSALTNGNVYLNSVENGAVTSTHKISGSGATTVTTDASGNIVISSTDTNTNTVTTVTTTGSGNAITALSASNGAITATKGITFLTAHPTISKSTDTTSTATATHGGTITMVDSVTRDSNGHVTKVNTKTVTLPTDADTKYTHPTTSGNKHIPSGGSSGQILRWSADGTAVWGADNNTTYSNMTAATSTTDGKSGLVPIPVAGKQSSFLRGDGTWATPTNTKNTAGSTNSTAKLYLIGATSQSANPQTYSHDTVYVGEDGCLYSNGLRLFTEINQTTEPTNQLVGDHWLVEY